MPKRSAAGQRNFGLRPEGAGKGDADRSPGWRDKYNDINWPDGGRQLRAGRYRKVYGATKKDKSLNYYEQPNPDGGDMPSV